MKKIIVLSFLFIAACAEPIATREYEKNLGTVVATHYSYDGGGVGITTGGNLAITPGSGSNYAVTIEYDSGEREIVKVGKSVFMQLEDGSRVSTKCREIIYDDDSVKNKCDWRPSPVSTGQRDDG